MLSAFHDTIRPGESVASSFQTQDMVVTETLEAAYRHDENFVTEETDLGHQTTWPLINSVVEKAVVKQLHTTLSIYGSGGVFGEFENAFKRWHGLPDAHALLYNSGTNALQAAYYAAGFMKDDEVIFPVYTFHATCSPAMHFGITPVFCDCDSSGNISPDEISKKLTARTKAVVVTHMWGIPCDIVSIKAIIQSYNKSIVLIEDCSHAHGAQINKHYVGTFGDAAAWSLQGQKIVSGGEGGIVLTKHQQWYHKMLLWGHYNKRCKEEIPHENPLRAYALTGAGKKDRAHPLAVSVALTQLGQLGEFHDYKSIYAERMIRSFAGIPFLRMPHTNSSSSPAWYAMILQFDAQAAPMGMNRDDFVAKLHQAGLQDIDIPKSTGLLYQEPLFTQPEKLLPHVQFGDSATLRDTHFPQAQIFYNNAIKVPVFARKEDAEKTDHYIAVIKQVAEEWKPVSTRTAGEDIQVPILESRTLRLSKL